VLSSLLYLVHAVCWVVLLTNWRYLRASARAPGPLPEWPRLSVLIPARNEGENLRRLLPTLREQDYPAFEVIVYDDGSEDETSAVVEVMGDARIHAFRGEGPPPGWVGKVHALYQATRRAAGDVYLFLDADTALTDPGALRRLVSRWAATDEAGGKPGGVLSGLPRMLGGGTLLVSLVPFALATALPIPLIPRTKTSHLASLNGQCWLIGAEAYHRYEPHAAMPAEVLEDVRIGQLLKRQGMRLRLVDLAGEVRVWMYTSHSSAWAGFRKNAYLLQGGHPVPFLLVHGAFIAAFVIGPALVPGLIASSWGLKAASDVMARFSPRTALLAPVSLLMGVLLPIDSAVSHWTGRVAWKGRRVGRTVVATSARTSEDQE
jgi:hypothetical protein